MKSEVVYCWNCKTAMDIEGNYYKCSRCGATWNEIPAPCGDGLVVEEISRTTFATKYRPSRR